MELWRSYLARRFHSLVRTLYLEYGGSHRCVTEVNSRAGVGMTLNIEMSVGELKPGYKWRTEMPRASAAPRRVTVPLQLQAARRWPLAGGVVPRRPGSLRL